MRHKTITKWIDINQITPILTLNVNALNTPKKRQRLSEWIQLYAVYQGHIFNSITRLKVKRMEKDMSCKQ